MKVNGKLLMRGKNERIYISVYENCSRACSSIHCYTMDDSCMSKYQFYSIMFPLWLVVALVATSPWTIGISFLLSVGYGIAALYQSFKEV